MPRKPFRGKEPIHRFMHPEEFQAMLNAARGNTKARLLFLLMGAGGLRTIEATWLTAASIDTRKRGVWVRTAKRKGTFVRFVDLGEGTFKEVVKVAKGLRPSDALLSLSRRQIRYLFLKYREKAKIKRPLSAHSMRHLAALTREKVGASPRDVAEFLGHENVAGVIPYLYHFGPVAPSAEREAEIAKRVSEKLFGMER